MAVFSKKKASQQGHRLPSLSKLSQFMGEIKSRRRSLQKQHQQTLISFFPSIAMSLSSMSSSSSPQKASPSMGNKHSRTSLRQTMSRELSEQRTKKGTHLASVQSDSGLESGGNKAAHLAPSRSDPDLVLGEVAHDASLQQASSAQLPQKPAPSNASASRSTSENGAMEEEKTEVAGGGPHLVPSVSSSSTGSPLTESGHKAAVAPPELSHLQPSRTKQMSRTPIAHPELSLQQPSRSKEMTAVPSLSAVQAVKIAVSAILVLCFLYAGKRMAVAITLLGHLMVLLLTKKRTKAPSRMTEEGFLTSEKLGTGKSLIRSTSIPAPGRDIASPCSIISHRKNLRSRSMPRALKSSHGDQEFGDENLIMCSESSLAKGSVPAKGGSLLALADNIATLKLQVILLIVLCGLLHGCIMAICAALLCILILFEIQKLH